MLSEYEVLLTERQAKLRQTMRVMQVSVLLILDPINILYATGARNMTPFSTRTPARYLLLFAEGPAILYEYFGCEHLALGLPTIDDVRPARGLCYVSSGADEVIQSQMMAAEILQTVRDQGLKPEALAIDRFPLAATDALRAANFRLTSADEVLAAARRTKLAGEITLLREAMKRVASAASEMEAGIEPGRRETEVWADFYRPFIAAEGEYIATRLFQSGVNTFPYFQEAGERVMAEGDLVCFDTDTIGYKGYCTDFSRTYLCGDQAATPLQKDLYRKAKEQLDWNVSLIKPGASYEEIAHAAWPVPAEHQQSRYYCVGHGLGMSGEYPNISHAIKGQAYPIQGEIEAGMVLCIESYIGSAEASQGVKLEEQLLVTTDGVECMSRSVPFDQRLLSREF